MSASGTQIMIVEDEAAHAEAIRRSLEAADAEVSIRIVGTLREYRRSLLDALPDIALVDLILPDGRSLDENFRPENTPFPFVIMTSYGNEQTAVDALKSGATDYVVKSPEAFTAMPRIVARALREWNSALERKRGEEALRESEEKFRRLVEGLKDKYFFYRHDTNGIFTYLSPSVTNVLGYTQEEFQGHFTQSLTDAPINQESIRRTEQSIAGIEQPSYEVEIHHKDGSVRFLEVLETPFVDKSGKTVGVDGIAHDITERKQAEEALRESERKFRRLTRQFHALLDAIPDNITRQSPDLRVTWANRGAGAGMKKEAADLVGEYCYTLWHNKTSPCDPCPVLKTFTTGEPALEIVTTPDGKTWELRSVPVKEAGSVVEVVEIGRDISEHRKLEEQFRQAQKMEAVGRLAGGVAHDFNNMLNVILGYADIALTRLDSGDPLARIVREIQKAGQRSADLTRQLLAFSRKQVVAPIVLNLNKETEDQLKMLGRLIGEDVRIDFLPAGDLWNTRIDPSQVSQILANLSVNARDAIAGVGTVTIETANVTVDEAYCREHHYVTPGEYVMVSFSDTGAGMDAATRERIFEPFFTTKGEGKGTGLGMSTVYGIVKQNGGFVQVYSEPGQGTTIRIYFPGVKDSTEDLVEKMAEGSFEGTETVLIVEDEEQILVLSRRILEQYGYRVLTARTPEDACRLVEEQVGDIHLLLTDVILPGMNGKELKERIETMRPGIKTVFMSGYTANAIARRGILEKGVAFLQKPFSLASLARKIRQVLDSRKS